MVGRTLLHYTITAELGAGAMGQVYLARDIRTDRQVALKFLGATRAADPESHERLVREARAASRLAHPGIVTLHSLEEVDGQPFLRFRDDDPLQGMGHDHFAVGNWETEVFVDNLRISPL